MLHGETRIRVDCKAWTEQITRRFFRPSGIAITVNDETYRKGASDMLRWIITLSLLLGLFGIIGISGLTVSARADEVTTTTTTTTTTPATTPTTTDQPATTTGDTTTKPADVPVVAKPSDTVASKPSKSDIHDLLDDGKVQQAENQYLEWASYWHDDDAALIVQIEHAVLLQQFKDGKNGALLALAETGDQEAMNIVTAKALSGGSKNWTPTDMAPAIKLIGKAGDKNSMNNLRTLLYYKDAAVVNATIEALSNLGDKRLAPVLYKMFDDADAERSVYLAFALAKLDGAKQVRARFLPQLRFPTPGAREKAALVLAAIGDPICWPALNRILRDKKAPYYPLAIITLSTLPFPESQSFVNQALAGSEPEQLAALKCLNILPPETVEPTLISLLRDTTQPVSVRKTAVQILTARKSARALKEMLALAQVMVPFKTASSPVANERELLNLNKKYYGDGNPQDKAQALKAQAPVAAEALKSLSDYGLLGEFVVRESVRMQFSNAEEDVARAARVALYNYALNVVSQQHLAKAKH